jgi:lipopolysaccharide export LptBFGC system permease protein LptF
MSTSDTLAAALTGAERRPSPVAVPRRGFSWGLARYLSREVLRVFFFVLALIEFGYALLIAVVVSRRWDVDVVLVLPVLWRTSLSMLNDSVPIALLFASALVYGRLIADREVSGLKSFGLSFRELLAPVALIGAVATIASVAIVGFVSPEMNFAKGNVAGLLAAQVRNLGEGWNRSFRFGSYNLWITHYDGADLEGITLVPQGGARGGTFVPENVSPRAAESIFIYSTRGRVLTADEAQRELDAAETTQIGADGVSGSARGAEVDAVLAGVGAVTPDASSRPARFPAGAIVFRLEDVVVFFSNEILEAGEPSGFRHRLAGSQLYVPYDAAAAPMIERLPKQTHLPELWRRLRAETARLETAPPDPLDLAARKTQIDLATELHWRLSRIASFFLYPVLAGLIALFVNAENRYTAFFLSCLIVPTTFYGLGTVGRLLTIEGFPPLLAMHAGTLVLSMLLVIGVLYMDRRCLR